MGLKPVMPYLTNVHPYVIVVGAQIAHFPRLEQREFLSHQHSVVMWHKMYIGPT